MIFNLTGGGGIRKPQFSYTGNYLETAYQGDGRDVSYKLYTLTSSGVLTAKMKNADIWLCGGGSSGSAKRYIRHNAEQQGRRGGVLRKRDSTLRTLSWRTMPSPSRQATVGKRSSKVGMEPSLLSAAGVTSAGSSGGTGGGGTVGELEADDGRAKYPFGDTAHFQCHCAGGGGGARGEHTAQGYRTTYNGRHSGGTNGGNGGNISQNILGSYFISTASERRRRQLRRRKRRQRVQRDDGSCRRALRNSFMAGGGGGAWVRTTPGQRTTRIMAAIRRGLPGRLLYPRACVRQGLSWFSKKTNGRKNRCGLRCYRRMKNTWKT